MKKGRILLIGIILLSLVLLLGAATTENFVTDKMISIFAIDLVAAYKPGWQSKYTKEKFPARVPSFEGINISLLERIYSRYEEITGEKLNKKDSVGVANSDKWRKDFAKMAGCMWLKARYKKISGQLLKEMMKRVGGSNLPSKQFQEMFPLYGERAENFEKHISFALLYSKDVDVYNRLLIELGKKCEEAWKKYAEASRVVNEKRLRLYSEYNQVALEKALNKAGLHAKEDYKEYLKIKMLYWKLYDERHLKESTSGKEIKPSEEEVRVLELSHSLDSKWDGIFETFDPKAMEKAENKCSEEIAVEEEERRKYVALRKQEEPIKRDLATFIKKRIDIGDSDDEVIYTIQWILRRNPEILPTLEKIANDVGKKLKSKAI